MLCGCCLPELDPKLSADIWNNLGRLQGVVGLFSASERSRRGHAAKLGDCLGVRRSLRTSGNLRVHAGNLADAESDLGRAASYTCPACSPPLRSQQTNPRRSGDGVESGTARRARRGSDQLGAALRPAAGPGTAHHGIKIVVFNSVLSLGNAAMMTGDSAQVWRCLDAAAAYAIDSRSQIRLANARGAAYLERKDPADARAAFKSALLIADKAGLPATYEHRGPAQIGLVNALLLSGKTPKACRKPTGSWRPVRSGAISKAPLLRCAWLRPAIEARDSPPGRYTSSR